MFRSGLPLTSVFIALLLSCAGAQASEAYAAPRPAATAGSEPPLVLTAAPRESLADGERLYGPLAAYLSTVVGRPVLYQHPGSWGVYRTEMVRGRYDLVFDGPHFNGYRAERLNHEVLVRLPEVYQFAIIGRQDLFFTSMQRLAGRTFCSLAPPNLGAQVLLDLYGNPARQPVLVPGSNVPYNGAPAMAAADLSQAASDVRVSVLDGSGQLVRQFALGPQPAGTVKFSWDGLSNSGAAVPSGTYQIKADAVSGGQNSALPTYVVARVDSVSLGGQQGITLNLWDGSTASLANVKEIG